MTGQPGAWHGSDRGGRLPGNWAKIRRRILARDGRVCRLAYADCCTTTATEVDHITPGDNHHPSNLQAVCKACHARKSAREGVAARSKFSRWRDDEAHPGLM